MIHHILKYAEKRGLAAEAGFSERPLKWLIAFDDKGENPEIIPLGDDKKDSLNPTVLTPEQKLKEKMALTFLLISSLQ